MNAREIKELLDVQMAGLFTGALAHLAETERGEPVAMVNNHGELTHWFVPFGREENTLGFAIVSDSGKLVSYGRLAPGAGEKGRVHSNFFEAPPAGMLEDIRQHYPDAHIISRAFSYDQTPQRWGWRIETAQEKITKVFFVTPAGWYESRIPKTGWEGTSG